MLEPKLNPTYRLESRGIQINSFKLQQFTQVQRKKKTYFFKPLKLEVVFLVVCIFNVALLHNY